MIRFKDSELNIAPREGAARPGAAAASILFNIGDTYSKKGNCTLLDSHLLN